MDAHIRKVYVPMTETGFYILLCLQQPMHGYGIVQQVEQLTDGEIRLSPGTMYGTLSKMEKDQLIRFVREEEKRKIYCITQLGREVLQLEMRRIERLFRNVKEVQTWQKQCESSGFLPFRSGRKKLTGCAGCIGRAGD